LYLLRYIWNGTFSYVIEFDAEFLLQKVFHF